MGKYFDCIRKFMRFVARKQYKELMEYQRTKAACNFFLDKAKEENTMLTPMQAIKLVYFAHGYTLAILKKPLIEDCVEAWKFGAVIPSLYDALKMYGAGVIQAPILNTDKIDYWDTISLSPNELYEKYPKEKVTYHFTQEELEVLNAVWKVYKGKSGFELSAYIHKPGTPWTQVWENGGKFVRHALISNDLIQKYYTNIITPPNE